MENVFFYGVLHFVSGVVAYFLSLKTFDWGLDEAPFDYEYEELETRDRKNKIIRGHILFGPLALILLLLIFYPLAHLTGGKMKVLL